MNSKEIKKAVSKMMETTRPCGGWLELNYHVYIKGDSKLLTVEYQNPNIRFKIDNKTISAKNLDIMLNGGD
jgi:hypothetical protein